MIDASKILTSMLAGGTQAGGAGGLLGQIAAAAMQNPAAAQAGLGGLLATMTAGGQQAQGGLGGLLGGLASGTQPQARGGLGGMLGQVTGMANQATQTAQAEAQGSLGGLLGQLGNALQKAQGQGGQAQDLLTDFLVQAQDYLKNNAGGFGGGAAAGALAGLLLGTGAGRQIAGTAAKLGGLAAIGGLAYVALRNFQEGKPVVQGTMDDVMAMLGLGQKPPGFSNAAGTEHDTATILLRAMVAAAFADGEMSPDERQAIIGQMDTMGLSEQERAYMDGLLAAPLTIPAIAAACTSDEMKAQSYLAANIAIHADKASEVKFLRDFAAALGLDPQLVAHLDQAATEAKAARVA